VLTNRRIYVLKQLNTYPFHFLTYFHTATAVYTINCSMHFGLDNHDMESSKRRSIFVTYICSKVLHETFFMEVVANKFSVTTGFRFDEEYNEDE